ncbi:hypothetical protein RB620_12035 [Paenibacillus sp. LHD-117]|uniref:hypothetical protein n=1 Tax=Paenibacillus sp. LHD-117 TaxID=3071412 RepID=UPI0027DFA549|nr:hypothetical protein [Paenibacillus sp. LHD-117]MDQ6420168.1 hypothetical protein [Paenibacillus sp. LHD-117]
MIGKQSEHITKVDMQRYASGTLAEAERGRVDAELLGCEECLRLFMSVLDGEAGAGEADTAVNARHELPMPDMRALEDKVVAGLMLAEAGGATGIDKPRASNAGQNTRRSSWIQNPVAQYTIAASITLLLLASGALAGFSERLGKLDENNVAMPPQTSVDSAWTKGPSWSDQLVNRTGSWLDGIQASRFK